MTPKELRIRYKIAFGDAGADGVPMRRMTHQASQIDHFCAANTAEAAQKYYESLYSKGARIVGHNGEGFGNPTWDGGKFIDIAPVRFGEHTPFFKYDEKKSLTLVAVATPVQPVAVKGASAKSKSKVVADVALAAETKSATPLVTLAAEQDES